MTSTGADYRDYPRTLPPDDFWGQVRRTVNGQAVPPDQIAMIVEAVHQGLSLQPRDRVLDIGCGNGALSSYLFDSCTGLEGFDPSEYLIQVAVQNFQRVPQYTFVPGDAVGWLRDDQDPARFTKALCYGVFAYLSVEEAEEMLSLLRRRFVNIERLLLGNLPDRDRAAAFYRTDGWRSLLDDHNASIGRWWSVRQLEQLASGSGWGVSVKRMPPTFFAHHYRYDAVLEPI